MRIKESFYKYICGLVFENAKSRLNNAILVVDRQGGKKFEKEFQTYIKRKSNIDGQKRIKKVKMEDSHKNNLLQLADYIASGVYRKQSRPDQSNYIDLLAHREMYVQIRPKEKPTSIPKESTS